MSESVAARPFSSPVVSMSIHPFAVLLISMAAVLGGVLVLRLHAFLALVLGALLVAILTPAQALYDEALRDGAATIAKVTDHRLMLREEKPNRTTENYHLFRYEPTRYKLQELATIHLTQPADATESGWQFDGNADDEQPREGDLLVTDSQITHAATAAQKSVGQRLAEGFGGTCAQIGLLIAMASIIGKCLLENGSAERIVVTVRQLLGDRLTPLAFAVSSFIVAVPVFFDTVFYLMIPLARAMAHKSGKNYLLYVLSIVAGGSIAHSLVPPTPGPLFVSSELGVNLGLMMLGGAAVAATGVVCVFPYVLWANRRWPMMPHRSPVVSERQPTAVTELPAFGLAILPIGLPVVLIAGRTILEAVGIPEDWQPLVQFLGDKNVALILAAAVALTTLWSRMIGERSALQAAIQDALSSAGVIILITAAGGAYGSVLRSTGIAVGLRHALPLAVSGISLLLIAFLLTMLIRVAQGSATVAMIAAAGILSPLAATIDLPYHPLYLALAIGSGSKPLPWMNDSGFWIIGKMSGFTEAETLKTFTVELTIMGFACLAATVLGAVVFPLV